MSNETMMRSKKTYYSAPYTALVRLNNCRRKGVSTLPLKIKCSSVSYKADIYWNQVLEKYPNAQGVCYYEWPLSYNKLLHRQQLASLWRLLKQHKISLHNKRILEIGPGTGFWTSFFHTQDPAAYHAIELSTKASQSLNSQFPNATIMNGSISDELPASIASTKYDVIFIAMVLLHITDDAAFQKALCNIASVLHADGHIIILDSPLMHRAFGWQSRQVEGEGFDTDFHNKIRRLSTWQSCLEHHGLHIESMMPAFNVSQICFDFSSYIKYLFWGKLFYAFHRRILHHSSEGFAHFYGKCILALDYVLTRLLKQSMSAKWMLIKQGKVS